MIRFLALTAVIAASSAVGTDKIYSLHTRFTHDSLNLTAGELKQFSGHAMNMIRGKCPAVDVQKIFNVQKYIGKLLAKRDPKPSSQGKIQVLMKTITDCAKEGVLPAHEPEIVSPPPSRGFGFFPSFFPFGPMRRLVKVQQVPDQLRHSTEVPAQSTEDEASGTEASVSPNRRIISTTIFVRPEDMQEGIMRDGGFFNWIHRIFGHVSTLINRMNPFSHSRMKREVIIPQTFEDDIADDMPQIVPARVELAKEPYGKVAFGALIDEMCRIYCDKCAGQKEMFDFKKAAKQLLNDLFEEDSGLDAAAQQFLDSGFLNSIKSC